MTAIALSNTRCAGCRQLIAEAALVDRAGETCETCPSCEFKSAPKPGEWDTFVAAIRHVANGNRGEIDQNKVRPLIRGRIEHKHIGDCYRRAKNTGLIREDGVNRSDDHQGRNAGRWQPKYRLATR